MLSVNQSEFNISHNEESYNLENESENEEISMDNIIDKMILPPPFVKDTVPLTSPLPYSGKIKISEQGELLKEYITYTELTRDYIELYENALDRFVDMVNTTRIRITDNKLIRFRATILKPMENMAGNGPPKLLYPIAARERNLTYSAEIMLDISINHYGLDANNRIVHEQLVEMKDKPLSLGHIPVMIGSKWDNLHGLSDDELLSLGECINDVKSYFIIGGKEYVIISQDALVNDRILIFPEESFYLAKITTSTKHNAKRNYVQVFRHPKTYVYRTYISSFGAYSEYKKRSVNIFQIFRLLGIPNLEDIKQLLFYFCKPHLIEKIKSELAATMADYQHIPGIENDYYTLADIQGKLEDYNNPLHKAHMIENYDLELLMNLFPQYNEYDDFGEIPKIYLDNNNNLMIRLVEAGNVLYKYKDPYYERIRVNIYGIVKYYNDYGQLVDWLNDDGSQRRVEIRSKYYQSANVINKKLYTYAILIARLLEVHLGERKPDNRNSWANKMIKTGGIFIHKKLIDKWSSIVKGVKASLSKFITADREPTINDISLENANMTEDFVKSFKTNWNSLNNKKDDKITDILSRQSLAAAYAYVTRISTPGSRTNPNLEIRRVKIDQWGFIDANDVPEGRNCGLVQSKSIGCWISNEADIDKLVLVLQYPKINDQIDNYLPYRTEFYTDLLFINGSLYGFCNGNQLSRYASDLQRQGKIRYDVIIFYVEQDKILYISTNAGRPTRPLLLVNEKTQRLILDEKLESGELDKNFDFQMLLDAGCIEFVDPWKQEHIMLSQSINDLRRFNYEIDNTKIILNRMEQLLAENNDPKYLSIKSKKQPILLTWDEYKAEIDDKISELQKRRQELIDLINDDNNQLNFYINRYQEETSDESIKEKIKFLLSSQHSADSPINPNSPEYSAAAKMVDYQISDIRGDLTKYIEITERNLTTYNQELTEINKKIEELNKKREEKLPVERTYLETQIDTIRGELTRLQKRKKYTHCELDPNLMMSVAVSLIPLPEHNQAPRNTYFCSMGRQAVGVYHSNHRYRMDKTGKIMVWPTRPIFETQLNEMIGMDKMGRGQMTILAIMSYLNYNEEDAIIFNRGAVQRGAFTAMITKTIVSKIETLTTTKKLTITERFTRDFPRNSRADSRIYDHLDERGVARVGSMVKIGDCVIGKIRIITEQGGQRSEDESTYIKQGEEGIVDAVLYTEKMVKVKIRELSAPIPADKFASNHAQKSTIGVMLDDHQMPYIESTGTRATVIMNPHAIPSRMTIGQLEEMVVSKYGALSGERIDATAYNNFNIDDFKRSLVGKFGYNEWGWETMVDALTGERYKAQIFVGPLYYQRLRHMVREKAQFRARGIKNEFSRAPPAGKSRGGGIRFGEMERDVFMSHGAAAVAKEIYCTASDKFECTVCTNCRQIAYINTQQEFVCRVCGDEAQFAQTERPWAYVLIDRFLTASGILPGLGGHILENPERSSIKF